jgi:AmmeMemoRadiSam system protein B/AmmeMemoRadiSam system protein A
MSSEQRAAIVDASWEYVSAAILKRPARVADPGLAGASDVPLAGAYVTLKRGGHLRACTGLLGRPVRLADAVRQAAFHTATDDRRLPPISPTELPYIVLSVNLLFGLRPVPALGRDRVAALEVGKHGLRVHRGQAGGLLLPGVATEHGWDSETFLRHVCRKAGLPSTAWEDDGTSLYTFMSVEFGRPLGAALPEGAGADGPSTAELRDLAAHARANVLAMAQGMTANHYAAGVPDGNVAGLALTIGGPFPGAPWHLVQLALRPGVALQATLYSLCESAARSLPADPRLLGAVRVGLTILSDPALHGNVADPDLRGLHPAARALLAVDGDRSAWVFSPSSAAERLLELTCERLELNNPSRASLYSLAARSTESEVIFDTVPRPSTAPQSGARPAAVAGKFYPSDPAELTRLVDVLLQASDRAPGRWPAAMVPHAGLAYSGKVAAAVFNRLEIPGLVLVIGPKHTRVGVDWAVSPHAAWSVPGASLASDPELIRALAGAIPGLRLDAAAHRNEHAIEVELPFLGRLAPGSRVVGVALGSGDWAHCRQFAEGLATVIRGLPEPPLLLISSDMNHFATDRENRLLDETALRALETLDPEHLLETVTEHDISMCGVIPAVIVMETLRLLGSLSRFERVSYATSAEATGETGRVVGYAGVLLG